MVGVSRAGGSPRSPRMGIVLNLLSLSFLSFLIAGAAAQASTKYFVIILTVFLMIRYASFL